MADLDVVHVAKQYPTRAKPLEVLRDVSLQLNSGDNAAILGPSGCGKSTLLQIIGTLDQPTAGTVRINDQDPFTLGEPQLAAFRNQHIGFIFQEHHLLPQLTVWENVLLPTVARGSANTDLNDRAKDLIERVGLADRLDHRPAELSGGERQRVAVARALIQEPLLLLADEPTGSLDRQNAASIGTLLLELQQQEQAILVVVTHSLALAENMQQRWELNDGALAKMP